MHEGEERGGIIMVCSIARATLIPKPSHLHVEVCMFQNRDRVEKGFHFQLFQKQCGEAYRSRYTYFSDLVARTIKATSAQKNEWVRR